MVVARIHDIIVMDTVCCHDEENTGVQAEQTRTHAKGGGDVDAIRKRGEGREVAENPRIFCRTPPPPKK